MDTVTTTFLVRQLVLTGAILFSFTVVALMVDAIWRRKVAAIIAANDNYINDLREANKRELGRAWDEATNLRRAMAKLQGGDSASALAADALGAIGQLDAALDKLGVELDRAIAVVGNYEK